MSKFDKHDIIELDTGIKIKNIYVDAKIKETDRCDNPEGYVGRQIFSDGGVFYSLIDKHKLTDKKDGWTIDENSIEYLYYNKSPVNLYNIVADPYKYKQPYDIFQYFYKDDDDDDESGLLLNIKDYHGWVGVLFHDSTQKNLRTKMVHVMSDFINAGVKSDTESESHPWYRNMKRSQVLDTINESRYKGHMAAMLKEMKKKVPVKGGESVTEEKFPHYPYSEKSPLHIRKCIGSQCCDTTISPIVHDDDMLKKSSDRLKLFSVNSKWYAKIFRKHHIVTDFKFLIGSSILTEEGITYLLLNGNKKKLSDYRGPLSFVFTSDVKYTLSKKYIRVYHRNTNIEFKNYFYSPCALVCVYWKSSSREIPKEFELKLNEATLHSGFLHFDSFSIPNQNERLFTVLRTDNLPTLLRSNINVGNSEGLSNFYKKVISSMEEAKLLTVKKFNVEVYGDELSVFGRYYELNTMPLLEDFGVIKSFDCTTDECAITKIDGDVVSAIRTDENATKRRPPKISTTIPPPPPPPP